ncbi:MAG: HAD family phosphatase [Chloroflexi bacterium]|nr:HAD family phosphatase [Chloroflexota bacterium]
MPKGAVIFDMDGVITDSEPLYGQAVNVVLHGLGHHMSDEDHAAIMGSSIDYTWEWVIKRYNLHGDVAHWKREYDKAVVDLLSANVEPAPGLYALLDRLETAKCKIGLATSSQLNWVEAVLKRLKVDGRFKAIASTEMVREAKPAPDLYLLAARKLDAPPKECVAIEDTPRGIMSAKAAGMTTIAVRTPSTAHMDISQADHVIDSLDKFDLRWLKD